MNKIIDEFFLLNDKSKNHAIEGLRALAVLMVFNVHFFGQFYLKNYFLPVNSVWVLFAKTLHAGHLGVDVFFVISGFLIYRNLFLKSPGFITFLRHRVQRLFPSHLFVLLILSYSTFSLTKFVSNAFYLPSFIASLYNYNYVTWSLGWEWIFYVALLLIAVVSSHKVRLSFILIGAFVAVNFFAQYYWKNPNILIPDTFRFSSFFIGCAVAAIRINYPVKHSRRTLDVVSVTSLVLLVGFSGIWGAYCALIQASNVMRSSYYFLVGSVAAVLLYSLLSGESFMSKLFSLKILRVLGEMSYSFYLTHAMIGIPFAQHFTGTVSNVHGMVVAYFVTIVVTAVISAFVYYCTERGYFLKRKVAVVDARMELVKL